jgi:glutamine synthetase
MATPQEVLQLIRDEGAEVVDLRFCDLPGLMQHFSIPANRLDFRAFFHHPISAATDSLGVLVAASDSMSDDMCLPAASVACSMSSDLPPGKWW